MPISHKAAHLRGRLANASMRGDHKEVANLKRDLTVVVLEQHIRKVIAAAPPLTAEQRDRLTAVLHAPGALAGGGVDA